VKPLECWGLEHEDSNSVNLVVLVLFVLTGGQDPLTSLLEVLPLPCLHFPDLESPPQVVLSAKQQEVLAHLQEAKSAFVTGTAGTGKGLNLHVSGPGMSAMSREERKPHVRKALLQPYRLLLSVCAHCCSPNFFRAKTSSCCFLESKRRCLS
jgi:hypothetical protein